MVVAAPSDPEHLPFLVAEAQVFPAELALTWGSKAFLYRMTTVILYKNSHFWCSEVAGVNDSVIILARYDACAIDAASSFASSSPGSLLPLSAGPTMTAVVTWPESPGTCDLGEIGRD